ncbi:MAG: SMC family ATPase [Candidatus Nanoarchaeia archaeon]|jgi:DNA repair exonuclease SbcCD ATPase subunit|nr:SMC family ATPase [Candidatus Nanoarchaeia archaeon]
MKIEKIVLEGFLSYKKRQEIDLSNVSTCLVLGRINDDPDLSNGAGKSSLFESVLVNFFGKGSGRADLLDRYINDFMSKMYTEIIFKIDDQRFKSVRSKTRDVSALFECFFDTTNESLEKATWKKTDKTIEDILGLSSKTYCSTIYLNERESLQIITGTSSERKEILRELLNIELYEKASKNCNKQYDDYDKKVQVNINLIEDKQKQLEFEDDTNKKLLEKELELKSIKKELKNKEKDLKKLNEEKQIIVVKLETEKLVKEQIIQSNRTLKELDNNLKNIVDDIRQLGVELEGQNEAYKKFKLNVENDIKQKSEKEKIIKKQNDLLKSLDEIDKENKTLLKEIEKKSDDKTKIEKIIVAKKTELKQIQSFLSKLDNFENVCPVTELQCEVLKGEYKETLVLDKQKELKTKEEEIKVFEKQFLELKNFVDLSREKSRKLEVKLSSRQNENEKLTKAKLDLQKTINNESVFKDKEKQYEEYVERTKNENIELKNNLEETNNKIEEKRKDLNELEKKIDLDLQKKLEDIERSISSIDINIKSVGNKINSSNQDIGVLKNQIAIFDKMKSDIEVLNKNNEENIKQKKIYQTLSNIMGKDGIQKSIIKESIPLLEKYTMEFLKIFNEGSDKIRVKFDLDPKRKDGEFKKGGGLDILVLEEDKEPKDLQMYSGGETVRIVFSIVLSLAKLLSLRAGKKHETLIIDEKIAKLDTKGIVQFGEVISEISKIYKQVFVITHIETLKDQINGNEIIVNKTDEGSLVSIS